MTEPALTAVERDTIRSIDLAALQTLTLELVAAAGENPGSTEEATVAVLKEACSRYGLTVELQDVAPGRQNLIATLPGGSGQGLMFLGHSDVVPVGDGWSTDPFVPVMVNERIYGRGSTDMKGGLAAVVLAMAALSTTPLRGPVQLVCTVDEEDLGLGIRAYTPDAPRGRFLGCVVAEPTDLQTVIACRGDSYLRLGVVGRAAHSGRPDDGRNAIVAAADVLELIQTDHEALRAALDPLLGAGSWSVGTIGGGTGTSTVAAECAASIDRRLMPDEDAQNIVDAMLQKVRTAGIDTDGIEVTLEVEMEMPGFRTDPAHPLVGAAVDAVEAAGGERKDVGGWTAACDGGFISRDVGIPCIVLGPGGLNDQAHQANESVGVEELEVAARAYALLALRLVGLA